MTGHDAERHDAAPAEFLRIAWTSDRAREVWEPRIARIREIWADIERLSVLHGVRRCAVTKLTPDELVARAGEWADDGLAALPFALMGLGEASYQNAVQPPRAGAPIAFRVVIASFADAVAFRRAFHANRDDEVGELLGYPGCCRGFFRDTWIADGLTDTTWPMARRSGVERDAARPIDVSGHHLANILWRWMGVRAVPHLPCSFSCEDTVRLGRRLMEVGRRAGRHLEIDWLEEILSWPVEWSALHGIAEIKTPIVKMSTNTDRGAGKRVVRFAGTRFPAEGAKGLRFPYRLPGTMALPGPTPAILGRRDVQPPSGAPAWYAADNGFASERAMRAAHEPILQVAVKALAASPGRVIDLGCGNGALLKTINERAGPVASFGIDHAAAKIEHARELLPTGDFHCGDMFGDDWPWARGQRFALAILTPGRLLETDPSRRERLRQWLRRQCDGVLLYRYQDWPEGLETLARRTGFRLAAPATGADAGLAIVDGTSEGSNADGDESRLP